jgi:hypothetical protein
MARKLTSLFILTLLFVAVATVSAIASRGAEVKLDKVQAYGRMDRNPEYSSHSFGKSSPGASLGTYGGANGGSPGYIVGRTMEDRQNWFSAGRVIDWRKTPNIHFAYIDQFFPGEDYAVTAHWSTYTMFNSTFSPQGVWLGTPTMLYSNAFYYTALNPQVEVDTTGHALLALQYSTPKVEDDIINCEVLWDISGPTAWGTFLPDTLPQPLSQDDQWPMGYPRIEYQEYAGQLIAHVVALEFSPSGTPRPLGYWRRVGDNPTFGGWTYMLVTTGMRDYLVTASRGNGNVAVVYMTTLPGDNTPCQIYYVESTDGGTTWDEPLVPTEIIPYDWTAGKSNWGAWVNFDAIYDTDGYLHIVYNAMEAIDGEWVNSIVPSHIYHWSNRVDGGKLTKVAVHDDLGPMCGRGWTNELMESKPTISQCDTNLVLLWVQFGDPALGDTLDCASDTTGYWSYVGGYNADLYMSVSSTLNGSLWDRGRNVTNSHTPDCDSTVANSCDHDNYPSMSRYAMDVSAMGSTYWDAVPEVFDVRDILDPDYPDDGWYLDVQFINDLYPQVVHWQEGGEVWSYNPIKWFRLPCIDPIIKPQISSSHDDFLSPTDWVKAGEPVVIEGVEVENIGNQGLIVSSVAADVTTGNPSWVTIAHSITTINPGESDLFNVTLNPGGMVTTQEHIDAVITVASNDPDRPLDTVFNICAFIADTVHQIIWDTIFNDEGFALTIANQGSAGNVGKENVNMDFVYVDLSGPECTALPDDGYDTRDIYMYDMCPVMMKDGSGGDGTYAWNPFWVPTRSSHHMFLPVAGDVTPDAIDRGDYVEYQTDPFVVPDSTIRMRQIWYIVDGESFVVSELKITSTTPYVSPVWFGEWVDWDIPTLGSGNEGGFADSSGPWGIDYVYQFGTPDPTPPDSMCVGPDVRFGASGLLGYWYDSERVADPEANNISLYGGQILLDENIFLTGTDDFIVDSAWKYLNENDLNANNSDDADQQAFLSYGGFELVPDDTLRIFTVHASIYDGDLDSLQAVIDAAAEWHYNKFVQYSPGCCGEYSDMPPGVWPEGYTGNTNCSEDGKRTLSDISKLIDHVYISKLDLCCTANGNTNGSADCKRTLSDITNLIDAVYISKAITSACMPECED